MRELLSILPKPSRYTGIEEGSVHKDLSTITLHVALGFPDMYEVGMSYLGLKILSDIVNQHPTWWAERVFTPCKEAGKILQEHNCPLATLESDTPLHQLDAIGLSITHELCYTNVLYLLDLANIPLRSKQRTTPQANGKPWPIIIAGGGCTLAAEPLTPFVDIMLLGEGEQCLPALLALIEAAKQNNTPREELLLQASKLDGAYIPEFFDENPAIYTHEGAAMAEGAQYLTPKYPHHTTVMRQIIPNMDDAPYPAHQAIPFGAVHNRLALEIGRGCTRGCRFCQAGSIYRPARERSVTNLQHLIENCLTSTGFDDVSFLSLSTGDYSALKELFMTTVDRCSREQISVSLPSLRVGSIDDSIMERMAGIRRTGATLAPEAGSQRLRDVINKGITEEELILHVQKLFEHGWEQVKLYFMIGLPTETDEDLLDIINLCKKARDAAGSGIKRLQITASVSPFVPKPHTPFQWEPQISHAEIRRRIGVLLNALKGEKRIKLRWHEPDMSMLEGIFSRGDRRLADVVETAYRKGATFTSWIDQFSLEPWLESMKEHNLSVEEYTRRREYSEPFPWEHLQAGLSKSFFMREAKRALEQKTTTDCRYTTCHACGVCDMPNTPSLLRLQGTTLPPVHNILNNTQRDQEAHTVQFDQYGRVILKHVPLNEKGERVFGKKKPPAIATHLTVKKANLRFWYSRKDAATFLSQLELQDIFGRALRKSNVPMAFSQGFHPLPLISFGRAMPVGVASECEWFSVILYEDRSAEELVATLNKGLPDGIVITNADVLPMQMKNADALHETYTIATLLPDDKKAEFVAAWEKIIETPSILWQRETKKGIREFDARSFMEHITINPDSSVTIEFDWETLRYVSPLALCLYALEFVGFTTTLPQIALTKIAQKGL